MHVYVCVHMCVRQSACMHVCTVCVLSMYYQESITVGGVYSRETSNDICAWAACTVLLIAVLLLRRVTYKMAACDESRHSGLLTEL